MGRGRAQGQGERFQDGILVCKVGGCFQESSLVKGNSGVLIWGWIGKNLHLGQVAVWDGQSLML